MMSMDTCSSELNEIPQSAFESYESFEEQEYYIRKIQELANGKVRLFAREIELKKLEESRRMKSSLSDDEVDKQVEESRRMKRESKRPMKSSLSDDEVDKEVEEYRRMKRESKRPMESPPPHDMFDNKQVKESKKRKIKIESKQCQVEKSSAFVDEDALKKKMRKLRIRKIQNEIEKRLNGNPLITNEVTERLQAYISDDLNGSYIMPVIQKLLYSSDIKSGQNRLSMPINQLIKTSEFLTPQEKSDLDKKGEMEVRLLGPDLQMHKLPMKLIIWDMVSTSSYVLKTNWSSFVRENEKDLQENSIVQVWSFRMDRKLCFALAVVERPDPRFSLEEGSSSSS